MTATGSRYAGPRDATVSRAEPGRWVVVCGVCHDVLDDAGPEVDEALEAARWHLAAVHGLQRPTVSILDRDTPPLYRRGIT